MGQCPEVKKRGLRICEDRGHTIVESIVGILLVALVVSSIFSMVISTKTSSKKSQAKALAAQYIKQHMKRLSAYVAAPSEIATVNGPTGLGWSYPGDDCGGTPGCYALSTGVHDITSTLPDSFKNKYNASLQYTVTDVACGSFTCKQVSFQVIWNN